MKIHVTQEDIDKGERKCCYMCPIAQALNRQFPDGGWEVTNDEVLDVHSGETFSISDRTQRFIGDFDAGVPVKPFSFFLK